MSADPRGDAPMGPLVATCPACGRSVMSVEAPVLVRADAALPLLWAEVCYCSCAHAFLPEETVRLLRALAGEGGRADGPAQDR